MSAHVAGQPVSPSTYMNHRCRCDECRAAQSDYMRARRALPGRMRTTMRAGRRAEPLAASWVRQNEPDLWASFMTRARAELIVKEMEPR